MISLNEQQEYYNARWRTFEYANRLKMARAIAILGAMHRLKLNKPRIIDLGCGTGWLTAIVAQFGPSIGVDLSDEAVREASRKYPFVSFFQTDISSWNYPKGQFDIVISQEVIEHVENQAAHLDIAAELLRSGGYLILTTPNARTFYAMPRETRESWSNQPIENWLTKKELSELLERSFCQVKVSTIIPGYGRRGTYRFVNSYRLKN